MTVPTDKLLRAYRAVDRYPRTWLLTIMRNAQVNRVQRRGARGELHDAESVDRLRV